MASMETQLKEMKMIASLAPVCLAPAAFRLLKELFAQTVLKVTQGICVTFVKMVTMVTFGNATHYPKPQCIGMSPRGKVFK